MDCPDCGECGAKDERIAELEQAALGNEVSYAAAMARVVELENRARATEIACQGNFEALLRAYEERDAAIADVNALRSRTECSGREVDLTDPNDACQSAHFWKAEYDRLAREALGRASQLMRLQHTWHSQCWQRAKLAECHADTHRREAERLAAEVTRLAGERDALQDRVGHLESSRLHQDRAEADIATLEFQVESWEGAARVSADHLHRLEAEVQRLTVERDEWKLAAGVKAEERRRTHAECAELRDVVGLALSYLVDEFHDPDGSLWVQRADYLEKRAMAALAPDAGRSLSEEVRRLMEENERLQANLDEEVREKAAAISDAQWERTEGVRYKARAEELEDEARLLREVEATSRGLADRVGARIASNTKFTPASQGGVDSDVYERTVDALTRLASHRNQGRKEGA